MPMATPNPFARAQYLLAAHTPRQLPPDGGFEVDARVDIEALEKAGGKGLLHKKTASRRVSRLTKRANKAAGA